jgi:hypothetical protein
VDRGILRRQHRPRACSIAGHSSTRRSLADKTRVNRMVNLIGSFVGGWVGWWLGEQKDIAWAMSLGLLGSIAGLVVARRLLARYLED